MFPLLSSVAILPQAGRCAIHSPRSAMDPGYQTPRRRLDSKSARDKRKSGEGGAKKRLAAAQGGKPQRKAAKIGGPPKVDARYWPDMTPVMAREANKHTIVNIDDSEKEQKGIGPTLHNRLLNAALDIINHERQGLNVPGETEKKPPNWRRMPAGSSVNAPTAS